jgi:Uma2 family endonuclease
MRRKGRSFRVLSSEAVMSAAHPVFYTFAEYVRLEEGSTVKHEYLGGQIYARAGGSPERAALAAAIMARLVVALEGGRCRVHTSDLRIRVRRRASARIRT